MVYLLSTGACINGLHDILSGFRDAEDLVGGDERQRHDGGYALTNESPSPRPKEP